MNASNLADCEFQQIGQSKFGLSAFLNFVVENTNFCAKGQMFVTMLKFAISHIRGVHEFTLNFQFCSEQEKRQQKRLRVYSQSVATAPIPRSCSLHTHTPLFHVLALFCFAISKLYSHTHTQSASLHAKAPFRCKESASVSV